MHSGILVPRVSLMSDTLLSSHYDAIDADPSPKRDAATLLMKLNTAAAPATPAAFNESVLPTTYTARKACTNVATALSRMSLVTTSYLLSCLLGVLLCSRLALLGIRKLFLSDFRH
jgi:hypothetical protein